MENSAAMNKIFLRGELGELPSFSHENHNKQFYSFPLLVQRLSGTYDTINVVAAKELLDQIEPDKGSYLSVNGEVRSFNNKHGQGSRLVITVFAFDVLCDNGEPANEVILCGALCKEPVFRQTPLGRDICDVMLAVNRRYQRADYLPCIIWGRTAKDAAALRVGSQIKIIGRLQSREYIKVLDGKSEKRMAYEISAIEVEIPDAAMEEGGFQS